MTEPIVRMPLRIRYHECDQQGVVFNAHYLAYADMACFEAGKALFGRWDSLIERGLDLIVAESTLRFLGPCRYDDDVVVAVHTERLGSTSLVLRFDMSRDSELVNQVTTRYVWVDPVSLLPKTPPDDVREAFARHLASGCDEAHPWRRSGTRAT